MLERLGPEEADERERRNEEAIRRAHGRSLEPPAEEGEVRRNPFAPPAHSFEDDGSEKP